MSAKKAAVLAFEPSDFKAFEKDKWRSEAWNGDRLIVKRRLLDMGKAVEAALREKDGANLVVKSSLHHPYRFNAFCVSEMWTYLSRKDRGALKALFGEDLGQDLDPSYQQLLLILSIDFDGVGLALRIHPAAWWEGQNLKHKCRDAGKLAEFVALVNSLDGYVLTIHDWKKEYRCGKLFRDDLLTFFEYYTPGNHWLNVRRRYAKTDPLVTSPEFLPAAIAEFRRLLPVFQFVRWTEENNCLDLKGGG